MVVTKELHFDAAYQLSKFYFCKFQVVSAREAENFCDSSSSMSTKRFGSNDLQYFTKSKLLKLTRTSLKDI